MIPTLCDCKFIVITFTYFVVNRDVSHRSNTEQNFVFTMHNSTLRGNDAQYNSTSIKLFPILVSISHLNINKVYIEKHFLKISSKKTAQ